MTATPSVVIKLAARDMFDSARQAIKTRKLAKYLKLKGIDTRPIFSPISTFPYINQKKNNEVAKRLSSNGLSLPTYIGLDKETVNDICDEIQKFINDNK